MIDEIKRRKTPKKPGLSCSTGGKHYPQNESLFAFKCCDNIQRYPLDGDFPVDSIIHPLNWAQVIKRYFLHAQRHPIKGHNIHKHIKLSLPCEKRIRNTVNGMLGDSLQSITLNP